ncbi:MAG: hypothetical protein V4596_05240 [Bdellovibrionota bacterium]
MKNTIRRSSNVYIILALFFSLNLQAQQEQKVQTAAIYKSDIDELLTIKSVSILPTTDNVGGIYSRAVEEELKNYIDKNFRFKLVDSQFAGTLISPDDLEANPQQVKDVSQNIKADAVVASRITKGPDGITIQISLFLKADGKLISKEVQKEKSSFDIKQIKAATSEMFGKVIRQIPYDGMILSRNNALVTINLGKKNGLAPGQMVSAALLIKVNRHPKLNFIISSDKEVLGKIRLDKVDDTISFGQILTEKSVGAIHKDIKISGIDFVQYSNSPLDEAFKESSRDKLEKNTTFGENPKEWRPSDPPAFGKVGVSLGLGQMRYNTNRPTGGGSLNADTNLYPSVKLMAELWFTSEWIGNFQIEQGVMSVDNPGTGAPSDLSINQSNYLLSFGYNFMIQDDFFGPSILLSLGFASYSLDVDSSTPITLSSTKYSGFFFGLKGTVPVSDDKKWNMGGSLQYFLKSDLSESPEDSGSSDNTMTRFSILGFYQQNTKLRFTGSLDFSLFSTKFSGGADASDAIDASQKFTTLTGGVEYLF